MWEGEAEKEGTEMEGGKVDGEEEVQVVPVRTGEDGSATATATFSSSSLSSSFPLIISSLLSSIFSSSTSLSFYSSKYTLKGFT